jgi:hypothetical protein
MVRLPTRAAASFCWAGAAEQANSVTRAVRKKVFLMM